MPKMKGLSQGKSLLLFFVISGATLALVLMASAESRTWEALRLIGFKEILVLCILCALMFIFNAWRAMLLCQGLGHRVPFWYMVRMIMIGWFFGAITPLQSGMMPAEMYMLYKKGVPLGEAISVDVVKRITTMGVLAIGGVTVLLLNKEFSANKVFVYAYYYVVFFFILLTMLFLFVYLFPSQTRWMVDKVLASLHKRGVVKDEEIDHYVHGVVDDYLAALDFYLHKGRLQFLGSVILTVMFLFSQFIMAPVIIHGLGYEASFMDAFQAQVILIPMLYFAPTPGGSGVAEGGFALLFSGFIPKHLIGITVVLWRIFTTYIGVALGGIMAMGSINLDKVRGMASRKE